MEAYASGYSPLLQLSITEQKIQLSGGGQTANGSPPVHPDRRLSLVKQYSVQTTVRDRGAMAPYAGSPNRRG